MKVEIQKLNIGAIFSIRKDGREWEYLGFCPIENVPCARTSGKRNQIYSVMEMNKGTLEKMSQMRLQGMYHAFKTSLETLHGQSMTTDQFISWLVTNEWDDRRNRTIERAVKGAAFRYKASVEDIDYSIERGLDKNQVQRLAELSFVAEHKDLFITGSTGTGKSYLATALGYQACQKGYKVLYANTGRLLGGLKIAKAKARTKENRKAGYAHIGRFWHTAI